MRPPPQYIYWGDWGEPLNTNGGISQYLSIFGQQLYGRGIIGGMSGSFYRSGLSISRATGDNGMHGLGSRIS